MSVLDSLGKVYESILLEFCEAVTKLGEAKPGSGYCLERELNKPNIGLIDSQRKSLLTRF